MKKTISCLILMIIIVTSSWAATKQIISIGTTQTIIDSNGNIIANAIPQSVPVNTEFILNYTIAMNKLPEEDSYVDCEITFPRNIKVELLSCSPVQMLTIDKKEEPAISIFESKLFKYYEFLIPNNSIGCDISFVVSVPEAYSKPIAVDFDYKILEKTFLMKWGGKKLGIATGVTSAILLSSPITGTIIGAVTGLKTKDSTTLADSTTRITSESNIPYNSNNDIFLEMKKKFKTERLTNSFAHFSLYTIDK